MHAGVRGNLIAVVCKGRWDVFMLNNMYKSSAGDNFIMNMGELTCPCSNILLTNG
jgi:hypothetical protein